MGQEIKKVLVVDDEDFICELLDEFLSLKGYDVFTAKNGDEALLDFVDNKPDLVLLDIRMPGISGVNVLRKIKNIDKDVCVIMLSAFGDADTVQDALELGAAYYLQKPVKFEQLSNILDSLAA